MEEKKFDKNSIIGFGLIFIIVMWMMYNSSQTAKKEQAEKAKQEKIDKQKKTVKLPAKPIETVALDSTATDSSAARLQKLQATLGVFAFSGTTAKDGFTELSNEVITVKIANKGGQIAEVSLKKFDKIRKDSGELVALVKNNNANFNLELQGKDNRIFNTRDLFFEPSLSKVGQNQILSMKLKTGANTFLEYKYVLKPNDYMLDFDVRSQGLNASLNTSKPADLVWDVKAFRNEKSISYENRYTEIYYEYDDGKVDYAGLGQQEDESPEKATFIAYKQHLFASVLLTGSAIDGAKVSSTNLVKDDKIDTLYTKHFRSTLPLAFKNGELDYKMNWYYGPADYKMLAQYDRNMEDIIALGWGIFGWINKFIFIPLFGFLSSFMGLGIAIILFTVIIKLAMSPITFKSFLSQAKMKVLRPEITELGEKYSKDPMKKQQETMKLYNKAGVNPMAGCIPALIQLPFMYASFQFFPSAVELRQKGFLWADDLSSFDSVLKLPFNIPLYGDHVSLFALLAAIAIFFYMKMTSGDQQMQAPQQEGMPDMAKIMKIMIYLSPIMMLIFFNNYGSGLSLYNLMSNIITIGIMLVIKNYFIDTEKIHAQIQENKLKAPKKQGRFQQKLQEVMQQAEEQKKLAEQQKKKK